MAHTAILKVFKIYLKAKGDHIPSFAELLVEKYAAPSSRVHNFDQLFTKLFRELIAQVDNTFHKSETRKKAIGIKSTNRSGLNKSIVLNATGKIISGTIKGGRYGQNRAIADLTAPKSAHKNLSDKNVVLDNFYFLLYTPIESNKGVLMIQNYSDDSITDIFISFIKNLLTSGNFSKPTIEQFCPNHIKEAFKENGIVHELRFTDDIFITSVDAANPIGSRKVKMQVKITLPNGESQQNLPWLRRLIGDLAIGVDREQSITLEEFSKKSGSLKNDTKTSPFDLDSDFNIAPVINLTDRITFQTDNTPDWDSLAAYSKELLERILPEVYPENEEPAN